jgi:F-type H+-transporting ATPase subunit epsilon
MPSPVSDSPSAPPTSLHLEIANPAGTVWSGEARMVVVPGTEGELGILPRHLPLLTRLREGMVRIDPVQGEPLRVYVSGGYLEVQPDRVTVLADVAVRSAELDAARAEAARSQAEHPVAREFGGVDYAAAHAELIQGFAELARSLKKPR